MFQWPYSCFCWCIDKFMLNTDLHLSAACCVRYFKPYSVQIVSSIPVGQCLSHIGACSVQFALDILSTQPNFLCGLLWFSHYYSLYFETPTVSPYLHKSLHIVHFKISISLLISVQIAFIVYPSHCEYDKIFEDFYFRRINSRMFNCWMSLHLKWNVNK